MRLEGGKEDGGGMVWALEALHDGTLVTGDSSGRVQVNIYFEVFGCLLVVRGVFSTRW